VVPLAFKFRRLAVAALPLALAACHGTRSIVRVGTPRGAESNSAAALATDQLREDAISEEWRPYESYVHGVVDRVQSIWAHLLGSRRSYQPKAGTRVMVRFRLDRHGRATEILGVETDDEAAAEPCVAAIARQGSFGEWTPEMIAKLGESQEMTLEFFYE